MALDLIRTSMLEAQNCLAVLLADEDFLRSLSDLSLDIARTIQTGGRVLIAGNGGSMADAMHFAEECTGRFKRNRQPYAVMSLSDPTHLSCVSNDYGFEFVFSRMVEAFARTGDIVILLSTSGNSKNLLLAAESARKADAKVVGFIARGGGALAPLCDRLLLVPGATSDRIQELHMMSLHILVEAIELQIEGAD